MEYGLWSSPAGARARARQAVTWMGVIEAESEIGGRESGRDRGSWLARHCSPTVGQNILTTLKTQQCAIQEVCLFSNHAQQSSILLLLSCHSHIPWNIVSDFSLSSSFLLRYRSWLLGLFLLTRPHLVVPALVPLPGVAMVRVPHSPTPRTFQTIVVGHGTRMNGKETGPSMTETVPRMTTVGVVAAAVLASTRVRSRSCPISPFNSLL